MASKNHNPGCPCCDCYDQTFTDDYSSFTTADGEYDTDRWVLASGEELESGTKPSGAKAWFHTIHIKSGDCDLLWDGITIQFRDSAGTITDGTNSSNFVPGGDLSAGWQEVGPDYGTYLTLWVTPAWYAIIVRRTRDSVVGETSNRGSIQVVDRDNTLAGKQLKITAVGIPDLEIKSWRIAEASVVVSYNVITRECFKPNKLPNCTERLYQSLSNFDTKFFATCTIDRYEIIEPSPGVYECQYLDTINDEVSTIRDLLAPGSPKPKITEFSSFGCGISNPMLSDADFAGGQESSKKPGVSGGIISDVIIPASTAGSAYPKPISRYQVGFSAEVFGPGACEDFDSENANTEVAFGADGKAAAMWSLSLTDLDTLYFSCYTLATCPGFKVLGSDPERITTSATLTASAE